MENAVTGKGNEVCNRNVEPYVKNVLILNPGCDEQGNQGIDIEASFTVETGNGFVGPHLFHACPSNSLPILLEQSFPEELLRYER